MISWYRIWQLFLTAIDICFSSPRRLVCLVAASIRLDSSLSSSILSSVGMNLSLKVVPPHSSFSIGVAARFDKLAEMLHKLEGFPLTNKLLFRVRAALMIYFWSHTAYVRPVQQGLTKLSYCWNPHHTQPAICVLI